MYAFAAVFLLISGASSLIYEISWARLLSPHVGSDNATISIVLASFFLGMALGSYFSSFCKQIRINYIHVYIILELLIGLSALILLPIMANLGNFIEAYPYFATSLIGKLILSLGLLSIPTICIGATFPIVSCLIIQHKKEIGLRIGQLYFYNTLGAIVGSLSAGFILIPSIGLDGAIYFAACLNFLIVAIAWFFRKRFDNNVNDREIDNTTPINSHPSRTLALFSLGICGFVLLACEVAWSKYLSILTISSMQSFAIILASTLSGIAAGSWFIRHRISQIKKPVYYICTCFIVTAFLLMMIRSGLNTLPSIMLEINALNWSLETKQLLRYLIIAALLFPATFMFGVLFPLAMKLYNKNVNYLNNRVALAFSLNTIAGIFGALITGLWLLPNYGTDSVLLSMIVIMLLIPLYFMLFQTNGLQRRVLAISCLGIVTLSFASDGMDYKKLINAVDYRYKYKSAENKVPDYLYLKEGKNTVVSLAKYDNKFVYLQNNGLQESMIALNPKANSLVFESLQAYMPYFLHEDPKSAFVIGYGGGVTTRAFVETEINAIDVVEIEENIINAIKTISQGPAIALNDKRINLTIGDARTALLTDQKKYDIVTSQPSHPWISGAANLFTKEFFELVSTRLNDNGIFSQWIALFGMDVITFKSILKSFYEVFPYGFTMEVKESGDMMLIGSKEPLLFDNSRISERMSLPSVAQSLNKMHINHPKGLLWFFSMSRDEVINSTQDSILNTDLNIFSETHLSSIYANGVGNQDPYYYIKTTATYDLLSFLNSEDAKFHLFEFGKSLLDWNSPEKSYQIATQLKKIDSTWGKSLEHEIFYWKYDYSDATDLYNSQTEWLDISHYRQFLIHLRNENWTLSEIILNNIQSPALRQLAQATLLYEKEEWQKLLSMQPITQMDQSWQLMARLKQNDLSVLSQLASNTEIKFDNLKKLQLISDIYHKNNANQQAELLDAQIQVLTHARLNFVASLIQTAELENNAAWLQDLDSEVQYLDKQSSTN